MVGGMRTDDQVQRVFEIGAARFHFLFQERH